MVQHQKSCRSKINNVAILKLIQREKLEKETIDTFTIKALQCFVKYKSLEYSMRIRIYSINKVIKCMYVLYKKNATLSFMQVKQLSGISSKKLKLKNV